MIFFCIIFVLFLAIVLFLFLVWFNRLDGEIYRAKNDLDDDDDDENIE